MRTLVSAVIYRDGKFLVLKRKLNWKGWEFVKGNIEKGSPKKNILREIKEETGVKAKIIAKLPPEIIYKHEMIRGHTISMQKAFLVEYLGGKIKLSFEHSGYAWVDKEKAQKLLTYRSHKIFLKYAYRMVKDLASKKEKELIEKLSRKHVRHVKFNGKRLSLTYDNKKLSYRVVKKTVNDVGDWSRRGPVVYYDRNLDEAAVLPILIHEVVEKYVAHRYGLDVDTKAHKVATAVEKEFIADKRWIKQQKSVTKAWVKTNKRKVGKTKFY